MTFAEFPNHPLLLTMLYPTTLEPGSARQILAYSIHMALTPISVSNIIPYWYSQCNNKKTGGKTGSARQILAYSIHMALTPISYNIIPYWYSQCNNNKKTNKQTSYLSNRIKQGIFDFALFLPTRLRCLNRAYRLKIKAVYTLKLCMHEDKEIIRK